MCTRDGATPLRTPSACSSAGFRAGALANPSASSRAPYCRLKYRVAPKVCAKAVATFQTFPSRGGSLSVREKVLACPATKSSIELKVYVPSALDRPASRNPSTRPHSNPRNRCVRPWAFHAVRLPASRVQRDSILGNDPPPRLRDVTSVPLPRLSDRTSTVAPGSD